MLNWNSQIFYNFLRVYNETIFLRILSYLSYYFCNTTDIVSVEIGDKTTYKAPYQKRIDIQFLFVFIVSILQYGITPDSRLISIYVKYNLI